ncbi:MAG TPA: sigma-70 family RNA polymerase sigma factor [Firmicutes bacterium]|jgi:RNA polymerase sigma factor (sigma-70 family)|nr:sigma-70 family RNA polymerase sigma factor [Bacillota bacterium]
MTPKKAGENEVKGEINYMSGTNPNPFAEIVERFGDVVTKAVAYTLHSQARGRWYVSSTFSGRVDSDEIEELTHEVLMLLPKAIERFRGEAKAETYVSTIARNHVMRVLKKRAKEARRRLHMPAHLQDSGISEAHWLDNLHAVNSTEESFEETLANKEADQQALRSFNEMARAAGLTKEQAEVFRLRRSGWSDPDIAHYLKCSQGTVRKRYFDAKTKLRAIYMADPRWGE